MDNIINLDLKNYKENGKCNIRISARGIIQREDKYAMVYNNKYNCYVFPGGGIEEGETREEALIREVQEETGLIVIPSTIKYWGTTRDIRKERYDEEFDIFDMTSHYYICDAKDEIGLCSLSDSEMQLGYELRFVTLEEALKNNEYMFKETNIIWIQSYIEVIKKIIQKRGAV